MDRYVSIELYVCVVIIVVRVVRGGGGGVRLSMRSVCGAFLLWIDKERRMNEKSRKEKLPKIAKRQGASKKNASFVCLS